MSRRKPVADIEQPHDSCHARGIEVGEGVAITAGVVAIDKVDRTMDMIQTFSQGKVDPEMFANHSLAPGVTPPFRTKSSTTRSFSTISTDSRR